MKRLLLAILLLAAPQAWGALAVEAGYPINSNAGGYLSATSVTSTTSGASLLLAAFSAGGADGSEFPLASIAGGGLTWTQIAGASTNRNVGTRGVEWWYAVSASGLSSQTITATRGGAGRLYSLNLVLYSITGAAASPIGGSADSGASSNVGEVTVTATAAGSFVFAHVVRHDSGSALTADTVIAGGSGWQGTYSDVGNAVWHGTGYATTSGSGSYVVGTSDAVTNALVGAVEIIADSGGGPTGPVHSGMTGFWGVATPRHDAPSILALPPDRRRREFA